MTLFKFTTVIRILFVKTFIIYFQTKTSFLKIQFFFIDLIFQGLHNLK